MHFTRPTDYSFKGHVALLTANLFFGVNASFAKVLLNNSMNSYALSLCRMMGAASLFWIVSLFTKREKVDKKDLLLLIFASILGIVLNQGIFIIGLAKTSPIDAILMKTLTPVITLIFAFLYLKEPITVKKTAGVLIGFSGAIILSLYGHFNEIGSGSLFGNSLILFSSVAYAAYFTLFIPLIRKYSAVTIMKWLFLFASVLCLPFWYHKLIIVPFASFSFNEIVMLLFVVICGTFLSYFLIPIGQKRLRPTLVSMYIYVQPILVTVLSVYMGLGEFTLHTLLSATLIFLGVYLVTLSKSREQVLKEKGKLIK